MGDFNGTDVEAAQREQEQFGDLVQVGGPDSDPTVARDATYVLERPAARTYRVAHGSKWLMENRPFADYVMYLDDDSYLHIPRLFKHLERDGSPSLAMGFLMETDLDWSGTNVCDLCDPCGPCRDDEGLQEFCSQFPDMAMGGCIMAIQNCHIFNDGEDLPSCVAGKLVGIRGLAEYFGSKTAPRWLLGMGWVFGRRIVQYIGHNADFLKVRGAADVMLGFWLVPLEGVGYVTMNNGQFHDHPSKISTFSKSCSPSSVLVHRMTTQQWEEDFDADTCTLACGEGGSTAGPSEI